MKHLQQMETQDVFNTSPRVQELTQEILDELALQICQYTIGLYSTAQVFYSEVQNLGKKFKNNTTVIDQTSHILMTWVDEGSVATIRQSLLIHAVTCSLARTWKQHLEDQRSWYGELYLDQALRSEKHRESIDRLSTTPQEKRWLAMQERIKWDEKQIRADVRREMENWEPELSTRIKHLLNWSEWSWRGAEGADPSPDGIVDLQVGTLKRFRETYLSYVDTDESSAPQRDESERFIQEIFKIHEAIIVHFAQYHNDNLPTAESLEKIFSKTKLKLRQQYYQYVLELTTALGYKGHPDPNSIRDHVEELSFTIEQSSTYPQLWDVPKTSLSTEQLERIRLTLNAEPGDECDWTETESESEEDEESDDSDDLYETEESSEDEIRTPPKRGSRQK